MRLIQLQSYLEISEVDNHPQIFSHTKYLIKFLMCLLAEKVDEVHSTVPPIADDQLSQEATIIVV